MASENQDDGIVVEFSFGGVTLSPTINGLLTVTQNGLSTFVDELWFARAIADGIFTNPHPAVEMQGQGEDLGGTAGDIIGRTIRTGQDARDMLDLADAPDVYVIGETDDDVGMVPAFEIELTNLLNRLSIDAHCSTPDFLLAHYLAAGVQAYRQLTIGREKWFGRGGNDIESNFDLYVDGYTVKSTGTVGEMAVTDPEGRGAILHTKQLTAFLQRRIDPGNLAPE